MKSGNFVDVLSDSCFLESPASYRWLRWAALPSPVGPRRIGSLSALMVVPATFRSSPVSPQMFGGVAVASLCFRSHSLLECPLEAPPPPSLSLFSSSTCPEVS